MALTKTVVTVGPASSDSTVMQKMFEAGADIVRVNMSHASHEEAHDIVRQVRKLSSDLERHIPVFMDLQGPKIRVGTIAGDSCILQPGSSVVITGQPVEGTSSRISVDFSRLPDNCSVGDTILLNDGQIRLTVADKEPGELVCRVEQGGELSSHKGVAVPGVHIDMPVLTDQDIADVKAGIAIGVDGFFLSFVQTAEDISELHGVMRSFGKKLPVVAKIEAAAALEHLDAITESSDAILVARGDLGVEIPLWEVPRRQLHIIEVAHTFRTPVIVATEMLESMITHSRPTRAEVSDVTLAVHSGCDAVMLSAETASGNYPVESVRVMERIIEETEQHFPIVSGIEPHRDFLPEIVARSTALIASDISAAAVIVQTVSGFTAQILSRFMRGIPIYAFTHDEHTARQCSLFRGVFSSVAKEAESFEEFIVDATRMLTEKGVVRKGDAVVAINLTGHQSSLKNANAIRVYMA